MVVLMSQISLARSLQHYQSSRGQELEKDFSLYMLSNERSWDARKV